MEITTRPRSRRWRVAGARLFLAASVVAVFLLLPASLGLSQGVVSDDGMSGSVARGSLLLGRPVQTVDQLRVGDVISFADPGDPTGERRVTRRVVAIDGPTVVTRGDALAADDPWQLRVDQLGATLTVAAVPVLGYLQLWVPWLSWAVVALVLAAASLAALLAARREAGRDHVTVLVAPWFDRGHELTSTPGLTVDRKEERTAYARRHGTGADRRGRGGHRLPPRPHAGA